MKLNLVCSFFIFFSLSAFATMSESVFKETSFNFCSPTSCVDLHVKDGASAIPVLVSFNSGDVTIYSLKDGRRRVSRRLIGKSGVVNLKSSMIALDGLDGHKYLIYAQTGEVNRI